MNDSRVFFVQQALPRKDKNNWLPDIQSATRYGSIHFLFNAGERPYLDPGAAREVLYDKLRDFDPRKDWLVDLRMGDPVAFWEAFKMLMALGKEPRFLLWSRGLNKDGVMSNEQGYYVAYEPSSIYEFLLTKQQQQNNNRHEEKDTTQETAITTPRLGKRRRSGSPA